DQADQRGDDHPRSSARIERRRRFDKRRMQPRRGDPQGDPERRSRTSVYRGRIDSCFWLRVRASSAASGRKISASFGRSVRSSMRKKVTFDHPIFTRWPAQNPDRLQLFSAPTPNGVKVGIMLEETSLAYEPHRIDTMADESHDPAFHALNPNGKIPAIYAPDGPSGTPLALFESGAILLYLADKTGQFISADPNTRYETIQWVMWQMG